MKMYNLSMKTKIQIPKKHTGFFSRLNKPNRIVFHSNQ